MDKRAKAILSRVEKARLDAPEKPFEESGLALQFPCRSLRASQALTVRRLMKAYGGLEMFGGMNLTLGRGDRIAIVGPNGSGKTALFRILTGEASADGGEFCWSSDAAVAVLSQNRNALDMDLPTIDALNPRDSQAQLFARTALARLGLRGDMAARPVGVLSVGERTKVEIVAMLLSGANVLILDEPTNHLDLVSVEALETSLLDFPGAILFTSHDREFVNRLATEIIELG